MRVVARAPNHLGDGVMAMPALTALCEVAKVTVLAPSWGPTLYRALPARVLGCSRWSPRSALSHHRSGTVDARSRASAALREAEVALLFPPSLRVALEARRVPRRVGVAGDHRRWLLSDVVRERSHQAQTYAALVAVLGVRAQGAPSFASVDGDVGPTLARDHIGLNPVSVSGAVRQWRGFGALADQLDAPVVFYGGPGEAARVEALAAGYPVAVGLPLESFAVALRRCAVFVSNDSGAAHFARACGVPTVVLHGSTTAARTGPAGAVPVEGPELSCRPCYGRVCRPPRRVEVHGCLTQRVAEVRAAIEVARASEARG